MEKPHRPVGGRLEPRYDPYAASDRTLTRNSNQLKDWLLRTESTLQQIRCGLHSNIPPCCVAWFVTVYSPNAMGLIGMTYREIHRRHRCGRQYVPCPKCLLSGRVQGLLSCACQRYRRPYPPLPSDYLGVYNVKERP